ncbi:MAG TPA: FAD:protein FMN transferase [Acidimicrobiales bacterium]|nr:FAD:protein FMN transferase [Acidimicrobiales bacterium]
MPLTKGEARLSHVYRQAVMGTVVTYDVRTEAAGPDVADAVQAAMRWLEWVDDTFSTYKPSSEVCRWDRGELRTEDCSDDMRHIIALCHSLSQFTDGYFDAWAGGSFDPSGVVKGWSIDRASRMLVGAGFEDHLIDAGGDVCLSGAPGAGEPWTVAVRHPLELDAYCAVLRLSGGSVATSGTYERGLHVLDPHTGKPAQALVSATVVGPDLTLADAYATAALAMGVKAPAWLVDLSGYESMVVGPDGRGWVSPGFAALSIPLGGD